MRDLLLNAAEGFNKKCMDNLNIMRMTHRRSIHHQMANVRYNWNMLWAEIILEILKPRKK